MNRRNFLGLASAGVGVLGYMRFGEAEWLEVKEHEVRLGAGDAKTTPDGSGSALRLLHLSDFHASAAVSLDYITRAIELGLSLKPDLICLTGDFITSKYDRFSEYGNVFKRCAKAAPTFACIGNHDGGFWARRWGYSDWGLVGAMLQESGVTILHNQAAVMEAKGKAVQLIGVGDLWSKEINATKAWEGPRKDLKTVLLSHNPDSKDVLGEFRWDLMLSGHTHGGQFYLPILGTPFAPVRDHRYVAGLKPWRDRWIHVTKGVGNLHGMRFNCRPEVSLLRVLV
jgi:predicted MPP superfamily phosphohydrolase